MGLAENVATLATRVATEFKAVRTELTTALRGKQPAAPRWTNWRTRASGQSIVTGSLSDDGTAFLVSVSTGTEAAATANGRLEVSWAASAGGAYYLQQNTGGTVKRIGATFGFGPSANATSGSVALATWTTDFPSGTTAAQVHLAMTASSATFGVVVAGTVTNLINWPYAAPLAQDWTPYSAEVIVVGSTAFCLLPDGSSRQVTDSRIGSTAGYTAVWEFFRDAGTTTVPIGFYDVWASTSGPMSGSATEGDVARAVLRGIADYRAEDATDNFGNFNPVDHTLLGWNYDPIDASTTFQPSGNGFLFAQTVKIDSPITTTGAGYYVATAGATLTSARNYLGLYNVSGTLLRSTADLSTVWNSAGLKTSTWATPIALAAGVYVVAGFSTGTTRPVFGAKPTANGTNNAAAYGRSLYRSFSNTTVVQTAMPAALPAPTTFTNAVWFGLY